MSDFETHQAHTIRRNLEILLYEIPATGQARALRWHNGILQVADIPQVDVQSYGWYDIPMETP